MTRYLLDVNSWVALLDEAHLYHSTVLAFMQKRPPIATCPLVENGLIRVLNLPSYSKLGPLGLESVLVKLREICVSADHEFWPDSLSLRSEHTIQWSKVAGQQYVTDVYLLAMAVSHHGCLVTIDQQLPLEAVLGADSSHWLCLGKDSVLAG
jgi:predicted nucleic acid-binding protein